MARAIPNVFTVAPGVDFARVLVAAVLDGGLDLPPMRHDPLLLADLVIHVPTRRIGQALEREFARACGQTGLILPSIRPLGDPGDPSEPVAGTDDLPPFDPASPLRVISPDERRFLLLPMISHWLNAVQARRGKADAAGDPAPQARAAFLSEAIALSGALGRLIDEVMIEGLPLSVLANINPAGFDPSGHDEYWWMTRDFLALAARDWTALLHNISGEDQEARKLRLIRLRAETYAAEAGGRPVIVAGSTGSVRATADLMRVVARLKNGVVVLPGLDQSLETGEGGAWHLIGHAEAGYTTRFAHPQVSLKRTLDVIGIARDDVRALGEPHARQAARNRLVSEALRPAETTARWTASRAEIALNDALAGLTAISAPDERLEAIAIAVKMRETLADASKSVALVTPDRRLAQRVREELRRWRIEAVDSAPLRLHETGIGTLIRLLLEALQSPSAAALLALLKHPLVRLGENAVRCEQLIEAMELLVWRGRRFSAESRCETRVLAALSDPERRENAAQKGIDGSIRADLPAFAKAIDALLDALDAGGLEARLADLVERLIQALDTLTTDEQGNRLIETAPEWPATRECLQRLARFGAEVILPPLALAAVVEPALMEASLPPPADQAHPRALILGLLEARLVSADRIILGGLNEGSLPPAVDADPFLNRAMRVAIGLQPPERRIGQSAHDVTMLAGCDDLVLSHARRVGTQPGIQSRFLQRLAAFAGETAWKAALKRGEEALALAARLDQPQGVPRPIAPPDVSPDAPRIPEKLSVTEIETLRRDPYALYAEHILGLERLEPLDVEPGARDRGTVLHKVLEIYCNAEPPRDAVQAALRLREIGAEAFRPFLAMRERHHFWWQSFEAIIPAFVALDRAARDAGRRLLLEARAQDHLFLPGGMSIRIAGKIDRIEIEPDGTVHVIDYKSGVPPSAARVFSGFAPQLVISAALVQAGCVRALAEGAEVASIAYVPIGGKLALEAKPLVVKDISLAEAITKQRDWLIATLDDLAEGRVGWRSRIAPQSGAAGDYDHLARVGEWSVAGSDDEIEAEEG